MNKLFLLLVCFTVAERYFAERYVEDGIKFSIYENRAILAKFNSRKCYEVDLHIETYCNDQSFNSYKSGLSTGIFEFANGEKYLGYNYQLKRRHRKTIHKNHFYLGNYTYTFERLLVLERGTACPNETIEVDVKRFKIFENECIDKNTPNTPYKKVNLILFSLSLLVFVSIPFSLISLFFEY